MYQKWPMVEHECPTVRAGGRLKCTTQRTRSFLIDDISNNWGSRNGTVVRVLASHQGVLGSIPRPGVIHVCGLSLLLFLFLALRLFFGYSSYPLSSKTKISKFHFNLDYCQALYHEPLAQMIVPALPVFDIKFTFTNKWILIPVSMVFGSTTSSLKCPYRQFLFSYPILYITQWTSAKEKFDLDKMQSCFLVFKNVQICRQFGPPFAPVFPSFWMSCGRRLRNTRLQACLFYLCKFNLVVQPKCWKGAFCMDYKAKFTDWGKQTR